MDYEGFSFFNYLIIRINWENWSVTQTGSSSSTTFDRLVVTSSTSIGTGSKTKPSKIKKLPSQPTMPDMVQMMEPRRG
jgi:hypothetical protein